MKTITIGASDEDADWIKRVDSGKYQREDLAIHEELARQYKRDGVGKANHSKSLCMMCKEAPPNLDVLWNGGQSRAWFCDKCFPQWSVDKGTSIINVNRVDGAVPGRYKVNNSPNEKGRSSGGQRSTSRRSGGKGNSRQSDGKNGGKQNVMKNDTILKINGELVTLADLAQAWLAKANRFTSVPWNNPESDLSADDFAKVSLIDLNEPGKDKIKANIKLPYKSTPTGPVNLNALRAAASYLPQTDAPADAIKEAARKLVRLMREGGIEPGEATLRNAGMTETEKAWEVEIISKADEKRICYGIALRPDVPDLQNDVYTADEVEKAAHGFMIKSRKADWMHEKTLPQSDAIPVESYIAPADFEVNGYQIKKGDWIVGMHVPNPDYWQKIKKGEARAFSIRGYGKRTPV